MEVRSDPLRFQGSGDECDPTFRSLLCTTLEAELSDERGLRPALGGH